MLKPSSDDLMKALFQAASTEIKLENELLRDLFRRNASLYGSMSHGLMLAFEHIFVYLCLKGCLKANLPYTLVWEWPYPTDRAKKADLGILDGSDLLCLVEFKIWTSNSGPEIGTDIKKLLASGHGGGKYLFVIGFSEHPVEDKTYLLEEFGRQVSVVTDHRFPTDYYFPKEKRHVTRDLCMYLLGVL